MKNFSDYLKLILRRKMVKMKNLMIFLAILLLISCAHSRKRVDNLIKQLKDVDHGKQGEAAEALGEIGDTHAVKPLIAALKDENCFVRNEVAVALGEIGDRRAVDPLITALDDSDLQWPASYALGIIGDKRAVEPLITHLNDSIAGLEAFALGEIRDTHAVEPLITALRDMHNRGGASYALGIIGDKRAVEPLIHILEDENEKSDFQGTVAEALGNIKDQRAIPILVRALHYWNVSKEAYYALNKLGWHPQSIEDEVHIEVAKRNGAYLRKIWGMTEIVLLEDVKSNEYRTIENALYAFIGIGKEEIIQELINVLNIEGTKTMAEAFLNCGNITLSDAARYWALRNGYLITSGSGESPVNWGSW